MRNLVFLKLNLYDASVFLMINRSILFWDTRPTKSAHQSQMTSVNKPAVIPVSNPLKQLDLTWKPILKVQCM